MHHCHWWWSIVQNIWSRLLSTLQSYRQTVLDYRPRLAIGRTGSIPKALAYDIGLLACVSLSFSLCLSLSLSLSFFLTGCRSAGVAAIWHFFKSERQARPIRGVPACMCAYVPMHVGVGVNVRVWARPGWPGYMTDSWPEKVSQSGPAGLWTEAHCRWGRKWRCSRVCAEAPSLKVSAITNVVLSSTFGIFSWVISGLCPWLSPPKLTGCSS